MSKSIEERLAALEQENASLRKRVARQNAAWLFGVLALVGGVAVAGVAVKDAVFGSIKAREVVVVDSKGTIRARLGGDVPDAVMAGGRVSKRGTKASGLIIYDEEGIERGGYVTADEGSNAMITLDSKHRMAAILVAGPDQSQAAAMSLITKGSMLDFRADENGSRMTMADKDGVKFQQPAIATLSAGTCGEYREIEKKEPGKRWCQKRFSDAACQACLEGSN
ncbi:hypothetical protein [Massilia endophytica]|uniref:hypothetical protein n=1 Tax=Massilia endophytica TaxID=2899220 RepID=UPI001E560219|nr:hypothetical protein [Massilia endophytica]UGQ45306.1 hypothetical protein LSQ66_16115 [Massilia endophytica]